MVGKKVLVTGSSGLVGSALVSALVSQKAKPILFDIRAQGKAYGDIRNYEKLREAAEGVDGIIHLAAVSRVIWGEKDPVLCRDTNIGGLHNVLEVMNHAQKRPWLIFASSREVYGQPECLPVDENCPIRPVNVYGHTKVEGEELVLKARYHGFRSCVIRLSNVYGSVADYADRVIPAFSKAAAFGDAIYVEGSDNTFDFTHIDDVTRGILTLTELLETEDPAPPPIHFVSGIATTLKELAEMTIRIAQSSSKIHHKPPRAFDVARFYGNPQRANDLLGWKPKVSLEEGLSRLIQGFRDSCIMTGIQETIS
ncbi:MAG TPA: NAD-dependent epimerase/dehydratase family protein [Syntrophales bacterium]|mgnify:CR=1 FL=1|nr:NAD-dependent epimerase/dehydratase family protein [Syntrophales bacterium]